MPIIPVDTPALTIRPLLELRERYERRVDKDFDATVKDNRSDLLSQWRVGVGLDYGKNWKAELRYQYSHDEAWRVQKNFSTENSDLDLAWVENTHGDLKVRVGRQRLAIAHSRLFENSTWNNVGKSFDLIRVTKGSVDAFAGKVGLIQIPAPHARIAGVHLTSSAGESLYAYKHDRVGAGSIDIHTIDHDWGQGFKGFRVNAEAAVQFGSVTGKNHRAWAAHTTITGTAKGKCTPYVELSAASGGNSATESSTFDMLWGAGHDKYGMLDMTGWRNMNRLSVGSEIQLSKGWKAKAQWSTFSLRDKHDAWYNLSGGVATHSGTAIQDPTGASGRNLGQELALAITGSLTKTDTIGAGLGVFQPGSFVRKVTGHGDRQVYGYLFIQHKL